MKICIIGGGMLGLSMTYFLSKKHQVTLIESGREIGGIARTFNFKGQDLDRYYHFLFLNDYSIMQVMKELGIGDKIGWNKPKMGIYYQKKIYPFTNPFDLLRLKPLGLIDKIKFGLVTLYISKKRNWKSLESKKGYRWLEKLYGKRCMKVIYGPLMKKKFGKYFSNVNAAWSWNEIHRRAKSRKFYQSERLGYYKDSVQILIDAMIKAIKKNSGKIILNQKIKKMYNNKEKVSIKIGNKKSKDDFDKVIATIPEEFVYESINKKVQHKTEYLDVRCFVGILRKKVSDYFWINISDENIPTTVLIEFSNLRPENKSIIYIPYYCERDNRISKIKDDEFIKMNVDLIKSINPNINSDDFILKKSFEDKYAQAVFTLDYSKKALDYSTQINNLFIMNQSKIYPERSGVNECIRFAKIVARDIDKGFKKKYFFLPE